MTPALTILVVEDNPTTRKMLRLALTTEGYAVIEAADARSALTAAEQALPDLILQDLVLPDMDGVELLRRLRALPGGTEVPILALSGFLSRLEETSSDGDGFTALLVKPLEPSRLVEAIRACLPGVDARGPSFGRGRRLLIVDDDPVQLKLARIHFTILGFDVATAGDAPAGLRAARGRRPDVILSDVFMPETDGYELSLQIRRDPELAGVPVLLLSGQYGTAADQELARRVGASALVARTPDFAEVVSAIETALTSAAPPAADPPGDQLELRHARAMIHQLERTAGRAAGLAQRCGVQAAQLSLLSGVADALTREADIDFTVRDVLAATLDAAGISKGVLLLRDAAGALVVRQAIGFSEIERGGLEDFFGHDALLDAIVERGASVVVPSSAIDERATRDILDGAAVASAQIVPLTSRGRSMGALIIGGTQRDEAGEDSSTFARAMGNQIVLSLELARSMARLSASEQRYRTLLERANDYIAILTPDGIVREVNRRWLQLTGLSQDALVGRHIRDFAPAGKESDNERTYAETAQGTSGRTPSIELVGPDGSIVLMEFSNANVDVGGERLVFTIGRDVTEQRQLEDQLRQAQKLEAVGQLAGGVAHDFNNVLTAILGFAELQLADMLPDDPRRLDLLEIRKAGERAAGLTRQLLAFSRKQILRPLVLDINTVVVGMEPMLRRLIFENINLVFGPMSETGLIRIDPTQLEQILVNLAINAADAMPMGGKLTIDTANITLDEHYQQRNLPVAPGDYVMLGVTDTGIGMNETVRQRIFEPFFTTKGVGKGTGLGLATVYGIVKQSGGDIWVSSEPGRGATFKIFLPRVTSGTPATIEHASVAVAMPRGTETILLVEDDPGVRLLARVSLERAGYRVVQAESPKDGMRVFEELRTPVDLLVSDVIMPDSEGPPLIDRIRIIQPNLRVLYMSGYADEAIVHHGVLLAGTPFLQKPFTPLALARKVREVLDAPGSSA